MIDLFMIVFATLGFWHYVAVPVMEWAEKIIGFRFLPRRDGD